jgi:hypothetical protein
MLCHVMQCITMTADPMSCYTIQCNHHAMPCNAIPKSLAMPCYVLSCIAVRCTACQSIFAFVHLSVYPSFCLYVRFVCVLTCQPNYHLFVCLSVIFSIWRFVHLFIYLVIYVYTYSSVHVPIHLFVHKPICLSGHLSLSVLFIHLGNCDIICVWDYLVIFKSNWYE